MMLQTLALVAIVLLPSLCASAAEFAYYDLPAGAFPHDVAPAADGSVGTPRIAVEIIEIFRIISF
jgi:streptogramin lyase